MTERVFNALLARMRSGDMSALEPIYTEYYRKLSVDASYILGDSDGEDAASAAFIKLVEFAQGTAFKHINTPDAFMRTLVKHTAIDMLRSRKPFAELENAEEIPAMSESAESSVERRDVMYGIGRLSETERDIAVMFYIYGVKIKAIATELEMPVGTVKWRLNEIRTKLKEFLS